MLITRKWYHTIQILVIHSGVRMAIHDEFGPKVPSILRQIKTGSRNNATAIPTKIANILALSTEEELAKFRAISWGLILNGSSNHFKPFSPIASYVSLLWLSERTYRWLILEKGYAKQHHDEGKSDGGFVLRAVALNTHLIGFFHLLKFRLILFCHCHTPLS